MSFVPKKIKLKPIRFVGRNVEEKNVINKYEDEVEREKVLKDRILRGLILYNNITVDEVVDIVRHTKPNKKPFGKIFDVISKNNEKIDTIEQWKVLDEFKSWALKNVMTIDEIVNKLKEDRNRKSDKQKTKLSEKIRKIIGRDLCVTIHENNEFIYTYNGTPLTKYIKDDIMAVILLKAKKYNIQFDEMISNVYRWEDGIKAIDLLHNNKEYPNKGDDNKNPKTLIINKQKVTKKITKKQLPLLSRNNFITQKTNKLNLIDNKLKLNKVNTVNKSQYFSKQQKYKIGNI